MSSRQVEMQADDVTEAALGSREPRATTTRMGRARSLAEVLERTTAPSVDMARF